ncbi:MAG TPA: HDIG domain-containing protein [Patescibacteria group bacterium]|nr:HDIG domain-containing protein [Patescibacteria group bacterium]
MNDQTANGKERGEAASAERRFDLGGFFRSLLRQRRLPFLYLVVFLAASLFLFPPMRKAKDIRFREGDIADVDVIASFTFLVPLSLYEIESNRAKAVVSVPPIYIKAEETTQHLPEDLEVFMRNIADVVAIDTLTAEERLAMIRAIAPSLKHDPVELLLDRTVREKILREGLKLQKNLLEKGIINDASPLRRRDYPYITVIGDDGEKLVPTTPLIEQGQLESVILDRARRVLENDDKATSIFYSIVRSHLMPNLVFDVQQTRERREKEMQKVPTAFRVSENERIIAKHDKVTKRQVEILEALEARRAELEMETSRMKRVGLFFGKGLRIAILLSILALALYRFNRDIVVKPAKMALIFIVLICYLLLMALVVRLPQLSPYLIPVAFVSLITTAFFGVMSAVIFTLFAALSIVTHTDLPASYTFIAILAGTAGIISIAQLRERKNFYTIFLYVSLAYILGITGFSATEGITMGGFLLGSLWGITNGFACTILVMFLLPIFESLFNVTTNFTLMELSDLNRSILRRLVIEAPGTYHHSLMLGNMVEGVAGDIKANSLLSRVSAYYHDIGKLAKPEYFFENKGDTINKHEKLSPTMSALILASHVKEGVELARKEKLPEIIIDAIREHHGTTVMAYFYQKALEYDSHDSVNIDDFRYPGPRPRSKETAIIMLADSSEAAVRSLREPTAPRIRTVVSRILEARMNDGELDQSGLTLNDIAVIREKFVQFLTGIFHPRIQYPGQEEEHEREHRREDLARHAAKGERKGRV